VRRGSRPSPGAAPLSGFDSIRKASAGAGPIRSAVPRPSTDLGSTRFRTPSGGLSRPFATQRMKPKHVKQALPRGAYSLAAASGKFRSPDAWRVLAAAGFAWTFIDTEHRQLRPETVQDLTRSACVSHQPRSCAWRSCNRGARTPLRRRGLIFPRVESPELLEKA